MEWKDLSDLVDWYPVLFFVAYQLASELPTWLATYLWRQVSKAPLAHRQKAVPQDAIVELLDQSHMDPRNSHIQSVFTCDIKLFLTYDVRATQIVSDRMMSKLIFKLTFNDETKLCTSTFRDIIVV